MKRIELLSPAGNFDALKAAVNNGADAVYLGGSNFSARAFAKNFSNDEIVEAIKYAHLRNVKVYVTINTLLNDYELENAFNQAKFLYENNVDAILIQDLGLFYRIKQELPNLELHASTQMHIHNVEGVKNAKTLGFNRVVLARESSKELIKEASKEGIEIECFIHGAICVSYSGQCLMSSITKNRSANKGVCAQCCRLKYELYEDDKKISTNTDYLLSPKDMFLLADIPELIKSGVSSLKIEGRMKSPAYVAYVTRIYRQAIDTYYDNKEFKLNDKLINNLKVLFNRGFTNSYFNNSDDNLFNNIRPNHIGIEIGQVIDIKNNNIFIKLTKDINQFDGIRIISNNDDDGLILNRLEVDNKLVSKAKINEVIKINLNGKFNIGDKVVKTLDFKFEEELNDIKPKLIDLKLKIIVIPNKPLYVIADIDNKIYEFNSNQIIDKAIKHPLTKDNIIDVFLKKDDHPYNLLNIDVNIKDSFISLKELNHIRREFYNFLDSQRLIRESKNINQLTYKLKDISLHDSINPLIQNNYSIYSFLPVINPNSSYQNNDNIVVSEFGGLLLDRNKIAYYTLNVTNSYAYEFLIRLGFINVIVSLELSANDIDNLINIFKIRNNIIIKPYVFIKGRRTLMYISRNPFISYMDNSHKYTLKDNKNIYLIEHSDTCLEIKENAVFEAENLPNNEYKAFVK